MAYQIPVTRARAELADLINRVVYGGERVVVTRHGKPLVALVSAADLRRLARSDEEPAGERPLDAVAEIVDAPPRPGGPGGLGVAAEHQEPWGRGGAPRTERRAAAARREPAPRRGTTGGRLT